MNAIQVNSKFDGKCKQLSSARFKFSSRILRYRTLNKDSFSPVANIESSSVTGSSLKHQNTENISVTLEATVLKVIRIFLRQPVDNDTLVILNIIVTLITCKSIVLVNFNEQKLSNSKNSGKTDR